MHSRMHYFLRYAFLALVILLTATPSVAQRNLAVAPAQANEQRVALVIGNSAYKQAPLANPINDATDIANGASFSVIRTLH